MDNASPTFIINLYASIFYIFFRGKIQFPNKKCKKGCLLYLHARECVPLVCALFIYTRFFFIQLKIQKYMCGSRWANNARARDETFAGARFTRAQPAHVVLCWAMRDLHPHQQIVYIKDARASCDVD